MKPGGHNDEFRFIRNVARFGHGIRNGRFSYCLHEMAKTVNELRSLLCHLKNLAPPGWL